MLCRGHETVELYLHVWPTLSLQRVVIRYGSIFRPVCATREAKELDDYSLNGSKLFSRVRMQKK
jgi:hypothetical protein